ncbi:hypothetical protein [Stenotrophomonas sp. TWI1409]|uniref:hypothetical protein n=1 Tax=unclassified Stenotrophomonas TaxID=196198 RepID=UPI00320B164D
MSNRQPNSSRYESKAAQQLVESQRKLTPRVTDMLLRLLTMAGTAPPKAQEQMGQGIGRRLTTMLEATNAVFSLIPPSNTRVTRDALKNATINLQAFLIHTVGIMDNMAWTYVYWHGMEHEVHRNDVDLFKAKMQERLPIRLTDHLNSPDLTSWRDTYLKPYRDSLAHRIPPYIPETHTPEEARKLQDLERRIQTASEAADWDGALTLQEEMRGIQGHGYLMVSSFAPSTGPVLLHPQMLSDFETIFDVLGEFVLAIATAPRPRRAQP